MDKVVQTTLDARTYQRLSERAQKEGRPLKAMVREAIVGFLEEPLPAWEDDPIQKFIGSLPDDGKPRRGDLSDKHYRAQLKEERRARKAAEWQPSRKGPA